MSDEERSRYGDVAEQEALLAANRAWKVKPNQKDGYYVEAARSGVRDFLKSTQARRHDKREKSVENSKLEDLLEPIDASAVHALAREENAELMSLLFDLAELSEKERQAICLRLVSEYTFIEIAENLDIFESAAKKLFYGAREKLLKSPSHAAVGVKIHGSEREQWSLYYRFHHYRMMIGQGHRFACRMGFPTKDENNVTYPDALRRNMKECATVIGVNNGALPEGYRPLTAADCDNVLLLLRYLDAGHPRIDGSF